jgi:hypothetical protein
MPQHDALPAAARGDDVVVDGRDRDDAELARRRRHRRSREQRRDPAGTGGAAASEHAGGARLREHDDQRSHRRVAAARTAFGVNRIVTRDTSGQATMLRDQSKQIVSTLNNSGTNADRIYMQSQVDVHQQLLTMMDSQLIPSAHNDLLNLLQNQRASVAMHLDRARSILATLP